MKRLVILLLIVGLSVACGRGGTAVSNPDANVADEAEAMEQVVPGVVVSFDRAEELPNADPDLMGAILQWDADSLLVGEGPVDAKPDGANGLLIAHEGPEVVVSWHEGTRFFHDVTDVSAAERAQSDGAVTLPQVVELVGQPDENAPFVSIWGQRDADGLLADVVVFRQRP